MSLQRLRILPVRAFCKPDHGYLLELYFPALAGQYQSQSGKVPDTANPSMPIQICPAPPPLFRRIGLAIGYWEPMALTDVTRSPGCMVNLGFSLPALVKRHRERRKR